MKYQQTEQGRQCEYRPKTEVLSCNHCCSGKSVSVTYPECVFVSSGIQHAMGMRLIVICGLLGSSIFFQIISKTIKIFEKKKLLKIVVLIFSTILSVTFLSLSTNNWPRYGQNVYWVSCTVPDILV